MRPFVCYGLSAMLDSTATSIAGVPTLFQLASYFSIDQVMTIYPPPTSAGPRAGGLVVGKRVVAVMQQQIVTTIDSCS